MKNVLTLVPGNNATSPTEGRGTLAAGGGHNAGG